MSYRRTAVPIVPLVTAAALAVLNLALLSCDSADPVSPAQAQQPAVQATGPGAGPGAGSLAAGDSLTVLGPDGVAYSLAPGDFPFSTTVSSWQDAFSIKQAGTGRSGQFIVGNPSNTKEALMASHNGSGTALYAIARGTGRAGYYRIDNPSNGNGALIGETNGTGAGILAYTTGTGPAANFVVNNAGNGSAALRAETSGTGNLLELLAGGSDVGHIDRDGGMVLEGTGFGGGSIPVEGGGIRLMWYPGEAAIRAGYVTGLQWNASDVGRYSAAFGTNTIASGSASMAIGNGNTASGFQSLAGGYSSEATGNSAVSLGWDTNAGGNYAFAAGKNTVASGEASVALGSYASTNAQNGSFALGDASTTLLVQPIAPNRFVARFDGGYWLYSNAAMSAGVSLPNGAGSWSSVSDENMKENFRELDGESVLEKIALIGIREWNYRSQDPSIRHVGPTAQDFRAAFGLGTGDRTIATVDADGIALAGVKALERRTRAQSEEIDALRAENRALRHRLDRLEAALLDR